MGGLNFPHVPGFPPPRGGFWLFAYGSLMWNPEFPYAERRHAVLPGFHRALCVYSWVYRGTPSCPGLVFGLDRGGITQGIAFRIRARDAATVYAKVHSREMVTAVYEPKWLDVRLSDKRRRVPALCYVACRSHAQYAGRRSPAETARLVEQGHGSAGPCTEYVANTLDHLRALGIRDRRLEAIARNLSAEK